MRFWRRTGGRILVTETQSRSGGFVCVESREWHRLGQLHGLAVDPVLERCGIYVDTPVTNGPHAAFT